MVEPNDFEASYFDYAYRSFYNDETFLVDFQELARRAEVDSALLGILLKKEYEARNSILTMQIVENISKAVQIGKDKGTPVSLTMELGRSLSVPGTLAAKFKCSMYVVGEEIYFSKGITAMTAGTDYYKAIPRRLFNIFGSTEDLNLCANDAVALLKLIASTYESGFLVEAKPEDADWNYLRGLLRTALRGSSVFPNLDVPGENIDEAFLRQVHFCIAVVLNDENLLKKLEEFHKVESGTYALSNLSPLVLACQRGLWKPMAYQIASSCTFTPVEVEEFLTKTGTSETREMLAFRKYLISKKYKTRKF